MSATSVTTERGGAARSLRAAVRGSSGRRQHLWLLPVYLFLAILLAFALLPGVIAPQDPSTQVLAARNMGPLTTVAGTFHLLGTDSLGRDVFSRLVFGARTSLVVCFGVVALSAIVGVSLGVIAGYRGGWIGSLIMRVVDGIFSLPGTIMAIFFLFVAGGGIGKLIIVMMLTRWVSFTRVSRGLTLPYREAKFVEAAHAIGCGGSRIVFRHILPNILPPLVVLATVEMAAVLLGESALSFIGVGVQEPDVSWGLMIADGRSYLATAWWAVVFPGLFIFATAASFNILAPRVRGALDRRGGSQ